MMSSKTHPCQTDLVPIRREAWSWAYSFLFTRQQNRKSYHICSCKLELHKKHVLTFVIWQFHIFKVAFGGDSSSLEVGCGFLNRCLAHDAETKWELADLRERCGVLHKEIKVGRRREFYSLSCCHSVLPRIIQHSTYHLLDLSLRKTYTEIVVIPKITTNIKNNPHITYKIYHIYQYHSSQFKM